MRGLTVEPSRSHDHPRREFHREPVEHASQSQGACLHPELTLQILLDGPEMSLAAFIANFHKQRRLCKRYVRHPKGRRSPKDCGLLIYYRGLIRQHVGKAE